MLRVFKIPIQVKVYMTWYLEVLLPAEHTGYFLKWSVDFAGLVPHPKIIKIIILFYGNSNEFGKKRLVGPYAVWMIGWR